MIGAVLALLGGCSEEEPRREPAPEPATCEAGGALDRAVVIQSMWFGRAESGVSDGFDLDGTTTASCGIADFVAPDGATGIDNAFAYLLPALELTEAAAVESLVQAAIDSGELLITLELEGLDDPLDDPCVDLVLGRASGTPMIGTDGRILPGQTLDRNPDIPSVRIEDVAVVDGVFEAPFEITLPVTIFEIDLEFTLVDGRIRGQVFPDGSVVGAFGGGVDIDYLLSIALEENVDDDLHDILSTLLGAWADLAPDATGECTQVSITFGYRSTDVFFFDDDATSPATGG
jgi:hypothetical protein